MQVEALRTRMGDKSCTHLLLHRLSPEASKVGQWPLLAVDFKTAQPLLGSGGPSQDQGMV